MTYRRIRIGFSRATRLAADAGVISSVGGNAGLSKGVGLVAESGSLSISGQAATLTPNWIDSGAFAWQISDGSTLNTGASQSLELAIRVPSGSTYYASPDLLPGQTLQLSGTTLNLVGDSTVPSVNGDVPGSAKDTISGRDVVIEVMDSPLARARNLRFPLEWWGAGESTTPINGMSGGRSHVGNILNTEYGPYPCRPGDIIEISPGAVAPGANSGATAGYIKGSEESALLPINCSVTIRNIPGRGRWRLFPAGITAAEVYYECNGIVTQRPGSSYQNERITAVIEGGEIFGYGVGAKGIRCRSNSELLYETQGINILGASLTVRNCIGGQYAPLRGLSILSGAMETLLVEDCHFFDGGNGGGLEHNIYFSARTMTLRGSRFSRTRGYLVSPPPNPFWSSIAGATGLEGHILKLSAATGTIEGCCIDAAPDYGDQSILMQLKAGGNWTVRGNLFIDSKYPNTATGALHMLREHGGYGARGETANTTTDGAAYSIGATTIGISTTGTGWLPTGSLVTFPGDATLYQVRSPTIYNMASGGSIDIWPPLVAPISSGAKAITGVWVQNFEPFAGEFGNSILFEKNVFVGHYPRPVWRFPLQTDKNALRPATGGGGPPWTASERLSSFVCRDNIAMVHPGPMTNWDGNIGFPGVDNDKWILYDPNSGPTWNARGNTTLTYDAAETGFDDRALKLYTRTGGPIAATAGTVATKRFVWPHGYIDRTDAHRGLS